MQNPLDTHSNFETQSEESLQQAVLIDWCKIYDVTLEDIPAEIDRTDKMALYDSAFQLGAQKFLDGFLSQNENIVDIESLKMELAELQADGDVEILAKREREIAVFFQSVISSYVYESGTNYPVDILDRKEMNCVGASFIGGMLLKKVGIPAVSAGDGSHVFLIMTTSDNRAWWQDMQDGKEVPESCNQELTAEKIKGTDDNSLINISDIVAFAHSPIEKKLSFKVQIGNERWDDEIITIEPLLSGIETAELINAGFQYTNNGKHRESLEILRQAEQKAPHDAVVYLGLAKALQGLCRFDEAIDNCNKALVLDPSYSYVQDLMDKISKEQSMAG